MLAKVGDSVIACGGVGSFLYILNSAKNTVIDVGNKLGGSLERLEKKATDALTSFTTTLYNLEAKTSITLDETSRTAVKASSMFTLIGTCVGVLMAGYGASQVYRLGSQAKKDGNLIPFAIIVGSSTAGAIAAFKYAQRTAELQVPLIQNIWRD